MYDHQAKKLNEQGTFKEIVVEISARQLSAKSETLRQMSMFLTQAVFMEVCVHPKPGLVTRHGSGAHTDMSILTFAAGSAVLAKAFSDLQILGIGRNAHIGFNEPGTPFDSQTHVVDLTDSTIEANSRFFASRDQVPTKAISMGIASIMAAKKIILFAYGDKKADAIFKMVKGPVTEEVPASVLQNHPDVTLILDEAAAAKL